MLWEQAFKSDNIDQEVFQCNDIAQIKSEICGFSRRQFLTVVSTTFLLVCFLYIKDSTCENKENVFYLNSKALFVLG